MGNAIKGLPYKLVPTFWADISNRNKAGNQRVKLTFRYVPATTIAVEKR